MKRQVFVAAAAGVNYARALASRFGLSYDELPPEEQAFWVDAARIYVATGIVPMPDMRSPPNRADLSSEVVVRTRLQRKVDPGP
jgi:hypothetical protein